MITIRNYDVNLPFQSIEEERRKRRKEQTEGLIFLHFLSPGKRKVIVDQSVHYQL